MHLFLLRPDQIAGCCACSTVHLISLWRMSFQSLYSAFPFFHSRHKFLKIRGERKDTDICAAYSFWYNKYTYTTLCRVGYFEKLRAFCTQRTHFGPLPAISGVLTYIDVHRPNSDALIFSIACPNFREGREKKILILNMRHVLFFDFTTDCLALKRHF